MSGRIANYRISVSPGLSTALSAVRRERLASLVDLTRALLDLLQVPFEGGGGGGGGDGPDASLPPPKATTDAENEAKFVRKYLKLDVVTRERIGHRFPTLDSALGSEVKGFVSNCSYRGTACLDERLTYCCCCCCSTTYCTVVVLKTRTDSERTRLLRNGTY